MDNFVRYAADSEKVFVADDNGYIEVDPNIWDYIFTNPTIYIWESGYVMGTTMCYFFRLA